MRLFGFVCFAFLITVAVSPVAADEGFRFSENREVREVAPGPPVRVKLKKLGDGKYTWEITGTDVQKVIEADRALREYVFKQGLEKK
jgi:hypothetical protein